MSFHKDAYAATIIMEWHNVTKVFCLIWAHVSQIFSQVSLHLCAREVPTPCSFYKQNNHKLVPQKSSKMGGMLEENNCHPIPSLCVLRLFGLERIGFLFLVLEKATLCVNVSSMESEWISSQREKRNEPRINTWNVSGPEHARKPFSSRHLLGVVLRGWQVGFCCVVLSCLKEWFFAVFEGFSLWRWYDWS